MITAFGPRKATAEQTLAACEMAACARAVAAYRDRQSLTVPDA
ncbi:MAG: hypothetical protein R2736_09820 [Solirubrobacterales bacterium]